MFNMTGFAARRPWIPIVTVPKKPGSITEHVGGRFIQKPNPPLRPGTAVIEKAKPTHSNQNTTIITGHKKIGQ